MGSLWMKSCALICLSSLFRYISSQKSLCEDPYIHSADRMANNTYRVYRGDYYWDLIGLPGKVVKAGGPYRIWWPNMAPTTINTAIFTVVGGGINGFTFKYKGVRLWTWNQNGGQRAGGTNGVKWEGFPPETGFTAAYSDGDLDKKGFPMLVAFSNIRVYYFETKREIFRRIGDQNGYINGKNGEKFPPDLTAAMPFPSDNPDVKYYVYLFRKDKYCFRPVIGEENCKEWRNNRELFGCTQKSNNEPTPAQEEPEDQEESEEDEYEPTESEEEYEIPIDKEKGTEDKNGSNGDSIHQNFVFIYLSIFYSII